MSIVGDVTLLLVLLDYRQRLVFRGTVDYQVFHTFIGLATNAVERAL
jgi:hypothetical protein